MSKALTLARALAVLFNLSLVFILASCAVDIRQEVYTTDDGAQVRKDVLNSNLSDEEKKSFDSEVGRDGYQPFGKTVATILTDAEKDEAADRAAAAAAAEHAQALAAANADRTRALDNDLKIYPEGISVVKGGHDYGSMHIDAPFDDKDTFVFLVRNDGSKPISSFSADATLTNQGGETLFDGYLNDARSLGPGAEERLTVTTTPMDFSAVPHGELVRQANVDSAVVHYTVQRIEYGDGSTITRSQQ